MKKLLPPILLLLLVMVAGGVGWYWWQIGHHTEFTDNAYIRGDITPISAKVSGNVAEVLVTDNQVVGAGEPLVRILDHEFRVRLERGRNDLRERQAALLVASGKKEQQVSEIEMAKAQLNIAEVEFGRELEEFGRFERLYREDVISPIEYGAALADKNKCQAEVRESEARLRIAEKQLAVLDAEEKRIRADVDRHHDEILLLEQALGDTLVCAPIAGTVGNRRIRTGQFVRPGSVLMALIPLDEVWVEANFKEVQLARMRVGQKALIEVDAFPDLKISGRIQSFAPASGAEFSLLPPENATGNFTKIVQRVPVKISLEGVLEGRRLLPGLSVEVTVDTRDAGEFSAELNHLADTSLE